MEAPGLFMDMFLLLCYVDPHVVEVKKIKQNTTYIT